MSSSPGCMVMGRMVDHEGDAGGLADLEDLVHAVFVVPGGVDHGGLRRHGGMQIVHVGGDDQLGSGEPDAAVPGTATTHDDDLTLHVSGVGQLVDIFGVGAGDAACDGRRDGARRAGGDMPYSAPDILAR